MLEAFSNLIAIESGRDLQLAGLAMILFATELLVLDYHRQKHRENPFGKHSHEPADHMKEGLISAVSHIINDAPKHVRPQIVKPTVAAKRPLGTRQRNPALAAAIAARPTKPKAATPKPPTKTRPAARRVPTKIAIK